MATPTQVTVDDPHAEAAHGGDGHAHEAPMLVGYDGQMHNSRLQHFFVSTEQQFEASKLGMWLFLATEILLFGALFVAYGIFRVLYPELYEQASLQLDTVLGAANTLVLLLSSLTMAWAIRGAQMDNRKVLIGNLIATILLASFFLVVKYFEYTHKFEIGIFPGINFELDEGTDRVSDLAGSVALEPVFRVEPDEVVDTEVGAAEASEGAITTADAPLTGEDQAPSDSEEEVLTEDVAAPDPAASAGAEATDALPAAPLAEAPVAGEAAGAGAVGHGPEEEHIEGHGREGEIFSNRRAGIFFAIYYVMTGIHALHIVIGIIAIGFLVFFASRGDYSSVWYTPVENVGLYWHVVDIIWIFVFPLMYLI